MVKEITGDLLRDGKGILCHQVNYQGVMGGGIAYSISKILPTKEYAAYQRYCYINGRNALGTVLYSKLPATGRVVANMFCQGDFVASDGAQPVPVDTLTDYVAMKKCFIRVRTYAKRYKLPVYIPGYIGCGIAGGDWGVVRAIIQDVFGSEPVETIIVYWERERGRTP